MSAAPNLFVVGAPKCGTTALTEYLREHPQVWFSDPKELNYLCDDFRRPQHRRIDSREEYLQHFAGAANEHRAVGEGSVFYLYSAVAARRIRDEFPDARVVAMVRNPVDMVHSLHAQLLVAWEEDEPDFEAAFRLQDRRRAGDCLPKTNTVPAWLQYTSVCSLGAQVQRLLATIPQERVRVILFDDFVADTRTVYLDLLRFLGLDDDGRVEFPRVNPNEVHVRPGLARLDRSVGEIGRIGWLRRTVRVAKSSLRLGNRRLLCVPRRLHTRAAPRVPLASGIRAELVDAFRDDVALLGDLLGRDLSHWLR